jgi:hypothetical protein
LTNAPLRVELRWRAADGQPQKATLTLVPGWYTIMLGSENSTT